MKGNYLLVGLNLLGFTPSLVSTPQIQKLLNASAERFCDAGKGQSVGSGLVLDQKRDHSAARPCCWHVVWVVDTQIDALF